MRDRQGRPDKLKAGLKYCGGCRPRYDRVEAVAGMKEALKGEVSFVEPDSKEAQCVLIVCGCPAACVDTAPFSGRPVRLITSEHDARAWIVSCVLGRGREISPHRLFSRTAAG